MHSQKFRKPSYRALRSFSSVRHRLLVCSIIVGSIVFGARKLAYPPPQSCLAFHEKFCNVDRDVVYVCVELWIPVKTPLLLLLLRIRVAHNFWCISYRAISLERERVITLSIKVRCVCLSLSSCSSFSKAFDAIKIAATRKESRSRRRWRRPLSRLRSRQRRSFWRRLIVIAPSISPLD